MYETKAKQMEDVKELNSWLDRYLLFTSTPSGYSSEEIVERYQLIMSKFDEMINDLFLSNSKPDKNEIKKKINEFVDFLIEKAKEDPLYLLVIGEFFVNINVENLTKEEVFAYIVELLKNFYKNEYFLENDINPYYKYVIEEVYPLILNKSNRKIITKAFGSIKYISENFEKILNMNEDLYQEFTIEVSEFYVEFLKVLQSRLRESFDEYTLKYSYIAEYVKQRLNKFLSSLGKKDEKGQIELFSFDDYKKVSVLFKFLEKYNKKEININEIFPHTTNIVDFSVDDYVAHDSPYSDFQLMCILPNLNMIWNFVKKQTKINYKTTDVALNKYFFFDRITFKEFINYNTKYAFAFNEYRDLCIKQEGRVKKVISINVNNEYIDIIVYFNNGEPEKIKVLRDENLEDETIITDKTKFYSIMYEKMLQILKNTKDYTFKDYAIKIIYKKKKYINVSIDPHLETPSGKVFPFDFVNDVQRAIGNLLDLFKSTLYNTNGEPIIFDSLEQVKINFENKFSEDILEFNFTVLLELVPFYYKPNSLFSYFIDLIVLYFRNNAIEKIKTTNSNISKKDIINSIYKYLNLDKLSIKDKIKFLIQMTYFYLLFIEKVARSLYEKSGYKEDMWSCMAIPLVRRVICIDLLNYLEKYYKDDEEIGNLLRQYKEEIRNQEGYNPPNDPIYEKLLNLYKTKIKENLKNVINLEELGCEEWDLPDLCYLRPFFDYVNYYGFLEKLCKNISYFNEKDNLETITLYIKIAFYLTTKTKDIENMDFPVEQEFYVPNTPGRSPIIDFILNLLSFSYRIE